MNIRGFLRRGSMRWLLLCMLLCTFLLFGAFSGLPPVQAHRLQAAPLDGHVTIIILDMSGSMGHNDGGGIRCSAVNAYIEMSGPGDEIGLIGLDGHDAAKGGPYNYELAQVWAQPAPMDTQESREGLRSTLASKDNNCRPDDQTPTYDALAKALPMLTSATKSGKQGSVILLTDGLPNPDQAGQESHIQSDLIPQFQKNSWPIDVIALGHDDDFNFLHKIAGSTTGQFYTDTSGQVPGESALNITPFFLDIFRVRNNRTPGPTLPATQISGNTFTHDFEVGDYVDHFDVIAIKDTASLSITLTPPGGPPLSETSTISGVFVPPADPYYVIFSIERPQKGTWHLNATGSGQFLMNSLIVSSLSITITSPDGKKTLPLNQSFSVAADLQSHGTRVELNNVAMQGTIKQSEQEVIKFPLTKDPQSGLYIPTQPLTMPPSANAGSYEIDITASAVSGVPIEQATLVVQFDLFPVPSFLSLSGSPTTVAVDATTVEWDPVLRALYSLPLPAIDWLSQWPLQHLPAQPLAIVHGEVELAGNPFPRASVSAVTLLAGSPTPIDTQVINDGAGRFHVVFASQPSGRYTVQFHTQGSFGGNSDIGDTTRAVNLKVIHATLSQELWAWGLTIAYLLLLLLMILLIRFPILPAPDMRYTIDDSSSVAYPIGRELSPLRTLLSRNLVRSPRALRLSGPGLQLLVNYDRRGGVLARRHGRGANRWFTLDEQPLKGTFTKVNGVLYSPSGKAGDTARKKYRFSQAPAQAVRPQREQRPRPGTRAKSPPNRSTQARRPNTAVRPKRRI